MTYGKSNVHILKHYLELVLSTQVVKVHEENVTLIAHADTNFNKLKTACRLVGHSATTLPARILTRRVLLGNRLYTGGHYLTLDLPA